MFGPWGDPDHAWLTRNVAYAQGELHLYGLTNQAPGLVIIGRDDPSAERNASRAQSAEEPRIAIHSWDWLLRHARNLSANVVRVSKFGGRTLSSVPMVEVSARARLSRRTSRNTTMRAPTST